MEQLRSTVLAAATLLVGLSAGVFFAYSTSVMLALKRVDDRTFVDVMQKINVAILNGWFLTVYVGALLAAVAAALLHLGGGHRQPLPWLVAAVVLYGVVFVVTAAINVPLNNQLNAAGPAAGIPDLAAVRASFEADWVRWNLVRTVASAGALLTLAIALLRR
ncbi:anthrone oxygenase family protein [Dactylosporangium sp. NPDC005572]|uniref:anthrone oxygenase family protein n=1 Tax=Dactylosporangium sp. NPDC005572 TaxID=3156889 RepID=UPI0033BBD99D